MKRKYRVGGMTCSACSANVEKSVKRLAGVESAEVNLLAQSLQVEFDRSQVEEDVIMEAVRAAGYTIESEGEAGAKNKMAKAADPLVQELQEMRRRLKVSFLFLLPLMYVSMGHMFSWPLPGWLHGMENAVSYAFLQFLLALPIVLVNRKYYLVGFKALFHRSPNMDSLIAIGSGAAIIYGVFAIFRIGYGLGHQLPELVQLYTMDLYFESAAMILALITLGKFLEARAKGRTSEAIQKLMDLAPKMAVVKRAEGWIEIPVEQVQVGDILAVRPGQTVPVDGVIVEGNTSLDQSALTGESIPVEKTVGEEIMAAALNKNGYIEFKATKVGDDTTLAQIIQLVEAAGASKAPIAKLADRVSGVFVPVVMALALLATVVWLFLGAGFEFALSIGITVLVISCPCALGLATPVAIMVGTGKAASQGILFKSAEALENAHHVDTVILDKTGTITEGRPRVTDLVLLGLEREEDLVILAASLEQPSEHPLAEAILEAAQERGLTPQKVEDFEAVPGRGIKANLDGTPYYAGNAAFMEGIGLETTDFTREGDKLAEAGKTPLYFASQEKPLGIIAVADVVKASSRHAVDGLKKLGLEVVMVTGDHLKTAQAIQRRMGIDRVVAEVLPQDKAQEVIKLQSQGKRVAMIGDGINDAPALAQADVGMAIGAGTDIAIESADVVLMKSDLHDAVTALKLSKATIVNIKQNLFWAFFYNILGIPLAAGIFYSVLGWKLSPMFAAAAMSLSSVFVVSNALRLRGFRPETGVLSSGEPRVIDEKKEEEKAMKKRMRIEGMQCSHCQGAVKTALEKLPGVVAEVDLEQKQAHITMTSAVSETQLQEAVEEAGFEVVSIEEEA